MKHGLLLLLFLGASFNLYAHSGNTDANDCHIDAATGIEHCHNTLIDTLASPSTAQAGTQTITATAELNADGSTTLTTITANGTRITKIIPASSLPQTETETVVQHPCTAIYVPERRQLMIPCAKVAEEDALFAIEMQMINEEPFTFVLDMLSPID